MHPWYSLLWSLKIYAALCYLIKASSLFCFQVAIKSIRKEKIKDEQDMVHIRREIEIMSSLRHPHIISIYEGEGLLHVWKCMHTHLTNYTHSFGLNMHKQKHTCPESSTPSAHSALVAELEDCHVMTCRCHNKTWTTALGCYSSSLRCLAAEASKSLDGFDGVHLDLCGCVHVCACTCECVCVCVCVCWRGVVF